MSLLPSLKFANRMRSRRSLGHQEAEFQRTVQMQLSYSERANYRKFMPNSSARFGLQRYRCCGGGSSSSSSRARLSPLWSKFPLPKSASTISRFRLLHPISLSSHSLLFLITYSDETGGRDRPIACCIVLYL